jgi:hypothetical protein
LTKATFKPRDVEEPLDYWLNRPLASVLVKGLAPLPITPNQVTLLSGAIGIAAGVMIAISPLDGTWHVPVAGGLLYLSLLFDCADGQLARLRGQSSMIGTFLDGLVDAIVVGAWFVGYAVLLYRSGHNFWVINAIGWSAGYSVKWQVHGYDHAKNVFLANTRPEGERARSLPSREELARAADEYEAKGDRLGAFCMRGLISVTDAQRRGWQRERMGLEVAGTRTDQERELYRARFAPTMKLWTWNGLAAHLTMLIVASLARPFFLESFFALCVFYLVPVNAFTFYLLWREKKIERELQAELRPGA